MLEILNIELNKIFQILNYDKKFAVFQYSDRPTLSDFQSNCAMPLAKILHFTPFEIASNITEELKKISYFSVVSIDGPGFINVTLKDNFIIDYLNKIVGDEKLGYRNNDKKRVITLDYGSPNVAKELHVGHLRSIIIGESLKRIFTFNGDKVIGDDHLGDWGTNMGMVIEGIRNKYPDIKVFEENFNGDRIDDLDLRPSDLLDLYQYSNKRAKDDNVFFQQVQDTTKLLQDGYKPYRVLWKYFWDISIKDINEVYAMFDTIHDIIQGESYYHEEIGDMIKELEGNGKLVESEGAKVIDITDTGMPPLLVVKSNGSYMYQSTDLATCRLHRRVNNPDLMLYVVDFRQSLHFKQLFESAKRCGYLDDSHTAEHISYGTMNGKDGKPFKTKSGDLVKLRDLVNDMISVIKQKSSIDDEKVIRSIAIACLKFADLVNYRESSYVFDIDSFTNYEGKTGAYILYSLVRINSILEKLSVKEGALTIIKTKEERDLLFELLKFIDTIKISILKRAPHFLAEYVYNIAKKFNSFYVTSPISTEQDIDYKKSKIAILNIVKKHIKTCLELLAINEVNKM
ncbi:MAG: arginine--tRNA ligase [Rickettsiales bacterium]|jgi:arginyl-tRNA synthetase|nr:arginine--tRNA ligase [Rickettsiales bacterium]